MDIAKRNYDRGLWTKDMLLKLIGKGRLTKDGYLEITGADPNEITPDMDLARAKAAKASSLSWSRDKAINGGITVSGMAIATDAESRGFITGAAVQAQLDPSYTCQWKTGGAFTTINAAQILAVATAVREHVQAQFDKEAVLLTQLAGMASIEQVKSLSWN
jgi:hypothetical protein